jgi:hypothetical protein
LFLALKEKLRLQAFWNKSMRTEARGGLAQPVILNKYNEYLEG